MDVCHILLGRPWQYDVQAIHRGRENTYEFMWMGRKIKLLPTTSNQGEDGSKNKTKPTRQLFSIIHSGNIIGREDHEVWALVIKGQTATPRTHSNSVDHSRAVSYTHLTLPTTPYV